MNDTSRARRPQQAQQQARGALIWTFGVALVGGGLLYWLLHLEHQPQRVQTGAIVAVMGVYFIVVASLRSMRQHLDQAGDNGYYLGLLFTLISMATALYEFGSGGSGGTEQIVSNFGIALFSTIVGVAIRVVLHLAHHDPADAEAAARAGLADAQLSFSDTLSDLSQDLAKHQEDIQRQLSATVSSLSEQHHSALKDLTEKTSTAIRKMHEETARYQLLVFAKAKELTEGVRVAIEGAGAGLERLNQIEPPPDAIAAKLQALTVNLQKLSDTITPLTSAFAATGATSAQALERIKGVADELAAAARASQREQAQTLERIQGMSDELAATARTNQRELTASASQFEEVLVRSARKLEEELSRLDRVGSSTQKVEGAANMVLEALTRTVRDITTAIRRAPPAT
jgi:gas vesicle protein